MHALLVQGAKAWSEQEKVPVVGLTAIFTTMVFLAATQDIAVDGWALTLLHDDNKTYASTAQTIGLNTGYFLSFTVFLALNSAEFSNKYLRSVPVENAGVLGLGNYLQFWGLMFLVCNFWLIFFKKEELAKDDVVDEITTVYTTIWKVIKMPHMKNFIAMLFICKIGFIANEAVTGLKLLEKGFSKEDLALSVLVDFPLQLVFGYYAAKWSNGPRPLRPWLYAFYGRLFFAAFGMLVVSQFPADGVTPGYFALVMVSTVLSSFMR
jgi:PAT family acetyl-CoA transporter-like MFS transporter 1